MTIPVNLVEEDQGVHQKQVLCALAARKQMLTVARLTKGGKYFCSLCGRVSTEAENVCAPIELSQIE